MNASERIGQNSCIGSRAKVEIVGMFFLHAT